MLQTIMQIDVKLYIIYVLLNDDYNYKLLIISYFLMFEEHENIVFERHFNFDTTQNVHENSQQLQFVVFFITQDDLFCEKYVLNNFHIYIEK